MSEKEGERKNEVVREKGNARVENRKLDQVAAF